MYGVQKMKKCNKCGHVSYSLKEKIRNSLLIGLAVIGAIALLLSTILFFIPSSSLIFGDFLRLIVTNYQASQYQNSALKELGYNITKHCDLNGYDASCIMYSVYEYFRENVSYMPSKQITPLEFLKLKVCDCSTCSIIYCSMLRNLEVPCMVKIDSVHGHAYSLVNLRGGIYKVDIAQKHVIKVVNH